MCVFSLRKGEVEAVELSCLPILRQSLEKFWASNELIQSGYDSGEGGPVGALFLPAIQH